MKRRSIISTVLTVVAIIAVIYGMWQMMPKQKTLKYNQIVSYFETNDVKSYSIDFNNNKLTLELREKDEKLGTNKITYTVPSIALFLEDVEPFVEKYNEGKEYAERVQYDYIAATPTPWWVSMLPSIIIVGVSFLLLIFMMRRMQDGGMGG